MGIPVPCQHCETTMEIDPSGKVEDASHLRIADIFIESGERHVRDQLSVYLCADCKPDDLSTLREAVLSKVSELAASQGD